MLGIQGQAAGITALNTQKNSVLQPPPLGVRAMGLGHKSFKTGSDTSKVLSKIQKRDKSQDKLTSMNIGQQILMNSKSSNRLGVLEDVKSSHPASTTQNQTVTDPSPSVHTKDPYSMVTSVQGGTASSATLGNNSLSGTGRGGKEAKFDHYSKQLKYKNRITGSQPTVGQSQSYAIGVPKHQETTQLPPVQSGRASRGNDIATKRRQIAVMRSRHFEHTLNGETAYNSVNGNINEKDSNGLCQNGFEN